MSFTEDVLKKMEAEGKLVSEDESTKQWKLEEFSRNQKTEYERKQYEELKRFVKHYDLHEKYEREIIPLTDEEGRKIASNTHSEYISHHSIVTSNRQGHILENIKTHIYYKICSNITTGNGHFIYSPVGDTFELVSLAPKMSEGN